MSLTDEQLAEIKADLHQASGVIDSPDAQYNPAALTAMRRAESLIAEVDRLAAQRDKVLDACDQVDRLISALGHETSGKGLIPQIRAIYAESTPDSSMTALAPEDDAPYEQADQQLADIERRVAAERAVITAATKVVQVWRAWRRRIENGSTEKAPVIPIKALAVAVDVLALTPAVAALGGTALPPAVEGCICSHTVHMEVPGAPVELNPDPDCPIHGEHDIGSSKALSAARLTTDPNDPRLSRGADDADSPPQGQAEVYLVLSQEERVKGFLRPLRFQYWHTTCGTITTMGRDLAETYARQPSFYGATYCVHCGRHRPVGPDGEFYWCDSDNIERQQPSRQPKVGT